MMNKYALKIFKCMFCLMACFILTIRYYCPTFTCRCRWIFLCCIRRSPRWLWCGVRSWILDLRIGRRRIRNCVRSGLSRLRRKWSRICCSRQFDRRRNRMCQRLLRMLCRGGMWRCRALWSKQFSCSLRISCKMFALNLHENSRRADEDENKYGAADKVPSSVTRFFWKVQKIEANRMVVYFIESESINYSNNSKYDILLKQKKF